MPSFASALTNCYIPLPATIHSAASHNRINPNERKSGDGDGDGDLTSKRSSKELRRLFLDRSIFPSRGGGSSIVELGHTKVICRVQEGPTFGGDWIGVLNCEVKFAPNFGIQETAVLTMSTPLDSYPGQYAAPSHNNNTIVRQETRLSEQLHESLSPSIVSLEQFKKCALNVQVTVLQDDGSTVAASITAATLALADAGVELYDLVSSCSVALIPRNDVVDGDGDGSNKDPLVEGEKKSFHLVVDPTEDETLAAEGVVTLAMLANSNEVTFWDQTGCIPASTASDAIELCRDGCLTMHKFMRQCLVRSSPST